MKIMSAFDTGNVNSEKFKELKETMSSECTGHRVNGPVKELSVFPLKKLLKKGGGLFKSITLDRVVKQKPEFKKVMTNQPFVVLSVDQSRLDAFIKANQMTESTQPPPVASLASGNKKVSDSSKRQEPYQETNSYDDCPKNYTPLQELALNAFIKENHATESTEISSVASSASENKKVSAASKSQERYQEINSYAHYPENCTLLQELALDAFIKENQTTESTQPPPVASSASGNKKVSAASKSQESYQKINSYDDYPENCTLLEEWAKVSREMKTPPVSSDRMESQNRLSVELMPKRERISVTMKQVTPMKSIREEDTPAPFIFNYDEYRMLEKHSRLSGEVMPGPDRMLKKHYRLSGEVMPKPDRNLVKIAPMESIEEEIVDLEELVDIQDIPTETDLNEAIFPAIQRCIQEGSMDAIPILLFAVSTPEKVMEVIDSNLLEDICKIQCAEHRIQVLKDVREAINNVNSAEIGDEDIKKTMKDFSDKLDLLTKEEK